MDASLKFLGYPELFDDFTLSFNRDSLSLHSKTGGIGPVDRALDWEVARSYPGLSGPRSDKPLEIYRKLNPDLPSTTALSDAIKSTNSVEKERVIQAVIDKFDRLPQDLLWLLPKSVEAANGAQKLQLLNLGLVKFKSAVARALGERVSELEAGAFFSREFIQQLSSTERMKLASRLLTRAMYDRHAPRFERDAIAEFRNYGSELSSLSESYELFLGLAVGPLENKRQQFENLVEHIHGSLMDRSAKERILSLLEEKFDRPEFRTPNKDGCIAPLLKRLLQTIPEN